MAIAVFRHDDGRHVTAVSVHRVGTTARTFTGREHRLCTLLAEELHHLYRTGRLEPPASPLDALPPSLRRVAERLLAGQSAKAVAFELGLSIHTVREHMRGLYARLGVDDLDAFLLRFAPVVPHPSPSVG